MPLFRLDTNPPLRGRVRPLTSTPSARIVAIASAYPDRPFSLGTIGALNSTRVPACTPCSVMSAISSSSFA